MINYTKMRENERAKVSKTDEEQKAKREMKKKREDKKENERKKNLFIYRRKCGIDALHEMVLNPIKGGGKQE